MNGAQVLMIILYTVNFVVNVLKHGEPGPRWNVLSSIFNIAVSWAILNWGGFWG